MSRLSGEIRQIGIVVRDIDAAMKHWGGVFKPRQAMHPLQLCLLFSLLSERR